MQGCKSDRSRQELSNEYLLAKIGVDTAENERASQSSFNFQVMGLNFHRAAPRLQGAASAVAPAYAAGGWGVCLRTLLTCGVFAKSPPCSSISGGFSSWFTSAVLSSDAKFGVDTAENEPYYFEISSSREFELELRSF